MTSLIRSYISNSSSSYPLYFSLGVFEKALNYFRMSAPELKEERAMLLDEWLDMEKSFGQLGDVSLVEPKLPKKLKKRKQIDSEDGLAGYVIYLCFYLPIALSSLIIATMSKPAVFKFMIYAWFVKVLEVVVQI